MSEKKIDGGPAFPSHGTMGEVNHQGMTLRDYFAAQYEVDYVTLSKEGQQQIMGEAPPTDSITYADYGMRLLAKLSYQYADAMLKERKK